MSQIHSRAAATTPAHSVATTKPPPPVVEVGAFFRAQGADSLDHTSGHAMAT